MAGNPSTCLIRIDRQNVRALVDSGAQVSLINRKLYNNLRYKPRITKEPIILNSVSGEKLHIDGVAHLEFNMKGTKVKHKFFVTPDINRNMILGIDFLTQNGVRLYYDLSAMRVGKEYIPMQEDCHINCLIRIADNVVIRPQTQNVITGKVKVLPRDTTTLLQVSTFGKGLFSDQPGLMVGNSITTSELVRKLNKLLPIVLSNETKKTYHIKKGTVLGSLSNLDISEVSSVQSCQESCKSGENDQFKNITVPDDYRETVLTFLKKNSDRLASSDLDLGRTKTIEMTIDTGDHPPIRLKPYRGSLKNREVIDKAVDDMLKADIIRPSTSSWNFPVVTVEKRTKNSDCTITESKRFCVDFRKLNAVIKKKSYYSYPLPRIDDLLALLGKGNVFSTLDLRSGFWNIPLAERDKEKTAFVCHKGIFEHNVMPFGLNNSPSVFQSLMNIVLKGLENFAVAYLDDILIFSRTPQEHMKHLQIVFDRLRAHDLKLKISKCSFLQNETSYLGFRITPAGIQPDENKVKAIRHMPPPKTVREARSFLGLISFYRRFVPNFSKIAEPIIDLTKKYSRFKWTNECQSSFEYLKDSLTVVPLLGYPDPDLPYILYTDASDTCIGACLVQVHNDQEVPVYFLSHKLSKSAQKWSVVEKEAFAINYSLQKLHFYLHGANFIIRTDHKPLQYILDSPMENKKVQMWALNISSYNCKVEYIYIKGESNSCADMLSRLPDKASHDNLSSTESEEFETGIKDNSFQVNVINSNKLNPTDYVKCEAPITDDTNENLHLRLNEFDMVKEQSKDQNVIKIIDNLKQGKCKAKIRNQFLVIENLVYFISDPNGEPITRLYIPEHLVSILMTSYHDKAGHMGVDKVYDTMKIKYYFPNMYKQLHEYVLQMYYMSN